MMYVYCTCTLKGFPLKLFSQKSQRKIFYSKIFVSPDSTTTRDIFEIALKILNFCMYLIRIQSRSNKTKYIPFLIWPGSDRLPLRIEVSTSFDKKFCSQKNIKVLNQRKENGRDYGKNGKYFTHSNTYFHSEFRKFGEEKSFKHATSLTIYDYTY